MREMEQEEERRQEEERLAFLASKGVCQFPFQSPFAVYFNRRIQAPAADLPLLCLQSG